MEYEVQVDNFEGPLDLLYKLVKKNKIEISNISLAHITEQYLQYIEHLQGFNLDLASEFMVIASELIEIKAKLLLPQNRSEEEEDEDKKDLVQRLEEYKLFKNASEILRDFEDEATDSFALPGEEELIRQEPKLKIDKTPEKLFEIYKRVISSNKDEKKKNPLLSEMESINPDRLNVEERTKHITSKIAKNGILDFKDLINNISDSLEIVVTLLSLLELMKLKKIKVKQSQLFANITVEQEKVGELVEY
jgi:segregation and condensation protein A